MVRAHQRKDVEPVALCPGPSMGPSHPHQDSLVLAWGTFSLCCAPDGKVCACDHFIHLFLADGEWQAGCSAAFGSLARQ